MFFFPFLMFWFSRIVFRNRKDAKIFIFPWCIATRNLAIISALMWFSTSFSAYKCMIYTYNKCLLFTSISFVKEMEWLTAILGNKKSGTSKIVLQYHRQKLCRSFQTMLFLVTMFWIPVCALSVFICFLIILKTQFPFISIEISYSIRLR